MRVRREGRKRAVKEGLATDADSGMTFKWEERGKREEKAEGHEMQLRKKKIEGVFENVGLTLSSLLAPSFIFSMCP